MIKYFLLSSVFLLLSSCATTSDNFTKECFVGRISPDKESSLQICFTDYSNKIGQFIYYSRENVSDSTKAKEVFCKQSFTYKGDHIGFEIKPRKKGRCGLRGDFSGPPKIGGFEMMNYDSKLDKCDFVSDHIITCKAKGSDTSEIFQRVKNEI